MSETDLYNAILRAHSRGNTRLLRINAGMAWQGQVIEHTATRLVLAYPHPIKLAAAGVSDLLGWTTVAVAGEGGLAPAAIFCAIEGKFGRRGTTPEQAAFLGLVRRAGGRAGVARSVEDAAIILAGGIP